MHGCVPACQWFPVYFLSSVLLPVIATVIQLTIQFQQNTNKKSKTTEAKKTSTSTTMLKQKSVSHRSGMCNTASMCTVAIYSHPIYKHIPLAL